MKNVLNLRKFHPPQGLRKPHGEFSRVALIGLMLLISVILASCSTPGYKHYLKKDESHRDIYRISASISSDGACSFSINGDEAENYGHLEWSGSEQLKAVANNRYAEGICANGPFNSQREYSQNYPRPEMFIFMDAPNDLEASALEVGVPLAVNPSETLGSRDSSAGVVFSILRPTAVREKRFSLCSIWLESLKGDAYLRSSPDGTIVLSIAALGYPSSRCF